ncbi:MAG TPA: P1 family peptidase [Hyphomicrobiaceae bacterium]|nr:P1 family peptidase [Hyphomicrobiaceae bacterium]
MPRPPSTNATTTEPGKLNLITDVPGILVGHAADTRAASGVTAILFGTPDRTATVAAVTRGGAPGTRDTTLLEPEMTVAGIHAVVLSGGSLFGLDAAGGVVSHLRKAGIGLRIGGAVVPIASQAICFDLLNGGDKDWGRVPPYWELGWQAASSARGGSFALGTVGGGYGATTATLKGGLGSASITTASGYTVGALAIVNAVGSATIGDGPHFWAAPLEQDGEFGGRGMPHAFSGSDLAPRLKGGAPPSTTIALVATDARLSKAEAKRIAIMADDGLARALRPAHAPMDGDTVFAAATGLRILDQPAVHLTEIGMAAGDCLARAIARGVYEATALPFAGALPTWREKFGTTN